MILVSVARRGVAGGIGAGMGVARCNMFCDTSVHLQNVTTYHPLHDISVIGEFYPL